MPEQRDDLKPWEQSPEESREECRRSRRWSVRPDDMDGGIDFGATWERLVTWWFGR